MKIYVAAVEALKNKERQGETQKTIKIGSFMSFIPCLLHCANDALFLAASF